MYALLQGLAPKTQGPPLITAAPVMGIMLGLLTGCDDAEERLATLTTLNRLVGKHQCKHSTLRRYRPPLQQNYS